MAVTEGLANVVSWVTVGLAIILTVLRLLARRISPLGYQWEDMAHCLGLAFLLVEVIVFHFALELAPGISAYEAQETDVEPDYPLFQRLLLVGRNMVWCCVWAIKISYLLLYRTMFGHASRNFMKAWWTVLAFTFISFWATIASTFVYCGSSVADLLNETVCDSETTGNLQYRYLVYGASLNIATDLAIMILPLAQLRKLPFSKLQLSGLGAIFSLSFFEIAAECVRMVKAEPHISSEATNFLLSSLVSSVAVWVSCVPSLHYLFKRKPRDHSRNVYELSHLSASRDGDNPTQSRQEASTEDDLVVRARPHNRRSSTELRLIESGAYLEVRS